MSEKPSILDEPLPDSELVLATSFDSALTHEAHAHSDTLPGESADHANTQGYLPDPHLDMGPKGFGHNDPASMAGKIQLDLHDPELEPDEKTELIQPIWGQTATPTAQAAEAVTDAEPTAAPKPELPPVLAHLTQVGLTSSDQWEEQIQPRLAQLHEDIAQVHTQLDMLERQKPKK